MSEQTKQKTNDSADNLGQAAKQTANAAKEVGKKVAQKAVEKGTKATVNAATATVKAGAATGKAIANIAAGTAAGGPWGAIIAAAWSMRHTLFKVLICICLVIVFFVVALTSLPTIIFDSISELPEDYSGNSLTAAYTELSISVNDVIADGHSYALKKVDSIIEEGNYDYDRSMNALIDNYTELNDIDVCYALAVYSASMQQKNVSMKHMSSKMKDSIDQMFTITYEVLTIEVPILSDLLEIIGTEIVSYVKCMIEPFDNSFFVRAFSVDLNAKYAGFNITYGEAIDFMANSLRMTLGQK